MWEKSDNVNQEERNNGKGQYLYFPRKSFESHDIAAEERLQTKIRTAERNAA